MELQHVKSFEGSPEPEDIFQPHMPGVELLSDMDEVFGRARRLSATGEYPAGVEGLAPEAAAEVLKLKGQHSVVIVTPGRLLMPVPAPSPAACRGRRRRPCGRCCPPTRRRTSPSSPTRT
jgi:hypothetical protein